MNYETRLQAAIVRDGGLLLVQCTLPGEPPFWVLPGGGREAGESDAEAVAREVREELGVAVAVGVLIDDVQADPPDGTYARWRTFACRLTGGEPTACGTDGAAALTAVRWLPLWGTTNGTHRSGAIRSCTPSSSGSARRTAPVVRRRRPAAG